MPTTTTNSFNEGNDSAGDVRVNNGTLPCPREDIGSARKARARGQADARGSRQMGPAVRGVIHGDGCHWDHRNSIVLCSRDQTGSPILQCPREDICCARRARPCGQFTTCVHAVGGCTGPSREMVPFQVSIRGHPAHFAPSYAVHGDKHLRHRFAVSKEDIGFVAPPAPARHKGAGSMVGHLVYTYLTISSLRYAGLYQGLK